MNFKMKIAKLFFLIVVFVFQGCVEYREDPVCSSIEYMSLNTLRNAVAVSLPREIDEAGKIYVYGDTLLVSEPNIGIHVIDNSDKNNPLNKAFITIPGNLDMAVKNGYLYADSFMDLIVIDIRDLENIQEVNRTTDIFPYDQYQVIAGQYDYYDCANTDKGIITGVKN